MNLAPYTNSVKAVEWKKYFSRLFRNELVLDAFEDQFKNEIGKLENISEKVLERMQKQVICSSFMPLYIRMKPKPITKASLWSQLIAAHVGCAEDEVLDTDRENFILNNDDWPKIAQQHPEIYNQLFGEQFPISNGVPTIDELEEYMADDFDKFIDKRDDDECNDESDDENEQKEEKKKAKHPKVATLGIVPIWMEYAKIDTLTSDINGGDRTTQDERIYLVMNKNDATKYAYVNVKVHTVFDAGEENSVDFCAKLGSLEKKVETDFISLLDTTEQEHTINHDFAIQFEQHLGLSSWLNMEKVPCDNKYISILGDNVPEGPRENMPAYSRVFQLCSILLATSYAPFSLSPEQQVFSRDIGVALFQKKTVRAVKQHLGIEKKDEDKRQKGYRARYDPDFEESDKESEIEKKKDGKEGSKENSKEENKKDDKEETSDEESYFQPFKKRKQDEEEKKEKITKARLWEDPEIINEAMELLLRIRYTSAEQCFLSNELYDSSLTRATSKVLFYVTHPKLNFKILYDSELDDENGHLLISIRLPENQRIRLSKKDPLAIQEKLYSCTPNPNIKNRVHSSA